MTPSNTSYREIPLTRGYVALVDRSDYERVSQFNWHALVGKRKDGTVRTVYGFRALPRVPSKNGRTRQPHELLHRFILGVKDLSIQVDHEDHDGLNCRRHNLRVATQTENNRNAKTRRDNTSGYKGVSWLKQKKRWRVRIMVNGRSKYLGMFADQTVAARRYDMAAIENYGEFACLNFPSSEASRGHA